MAKKDVEIDQTESDISVGGDPVKPEALWLVSKWGDYPQWRCMFCPFDTLNGETAILEHWREMHALPAPVVTPAMIPVYDRRGNLKSVAK